MVRIFFEIARNHSCYCSITLISRMFGNKLNKTKANQNFISERQAREAFEQEEEAEAERKAAEKEAAREEGTIIVLNFHHSPSI